MQKKLVHFDEVRNNIYKSIFLFLLFFLMVGGMGYIVGLLWGNIWLGIIVTLTIGVIYSLFAYFAGRRMIMNLSGAKEVTKKEYPFLYHTTEGLALAAGIPTPKCYVIPSPAMNAFATGRNPDDAAIAVTTGLLEKLKREELEGVLAHEIAHIKNQDIKTMMLAAILVGIVVILSDIFLRSVIFGAASGRGRGSGNIIFVVVGIALAILAPIIAEMIRLAISRKREYAADARGVVLTRNPRGLSSALRKISGDTSDLRAASNATAHMYISNPFRNKKRFFKGLFSTHPPIEERIARLEAM